VGTVPVNDFRRRFSEAYAKASSASQARLLAQLLSRLSMMARATYQPYRGVSDCDLLRNFNEAQNRISPQLSALLDEDLRRYPDDVFSNIIIDNLLNLKLSHDEIESILLELMKNGKISIALH
jgi:hypothetical protein